MALVTKMNRCAVCGSSQISLMADGKYYHCEACGATSNHTMPAADLAKVDRISLMGGGAYTGNWTPAAEYNIYVDPEAASTEEIEALRHRYPRLGLTTWTKENRVQL